MFIANIQIRDNFFTPLKNAGKNYQLVSNIFGMKNGGLKTKN